MIWGYAIAMVLVALFLLLWPLWRRSDLSTLDSNTANVAVLKEQLAELDADLHHGSLTDEQYQQARQDLETTVAADLTDQVVVHQLSDSSRKLLSIALVILTPLCSVLFYQQVTTYHETPVQPHSAQQLVEQAAGEKLPPVTQMVEALAERLRNNPDNVEGWQMLGRSYMILERPEDAVRAYGRAYDLAGDSNPQLIVDYAEALAFLNENQMLGKPLELVNQALKLQPDMPKALWLKGFAFYQNNDYPNAVLIWQKVVANPGVSDDTRQMMQTYISDAQSHMTREVAIPVSRPATGETGSGVAITVDVSLDESVKQGIADNTAVFVFARAASGPALPLAVKKLQVSELPATVVLDDSMAMMPGHNLASQGQVIVGARVSLSGSPMSQAGDIEGFTEPLDPASGDKTRVIIRRVVN